MRKLLALLLLSMCLPAQAANLFFTRCESDTLDGTHDHSVGDTSATGVNTPTYSSAAAKIGTNGCENTANGAHNEFTVSTDDIIQRDEGSVGLWVQFPTTWITGQLVFVANGASANDNIRIETVGTDDATGREFLFRHRVAGISNFTVSTNDVDVQLATWYFVVIRWDEAADDRRLEVYNTSLSLVGTPAQDLTTVFGQQTGAFTLMEFGDTAVHNRDVYIDNVMIDDDYSATLETKGNISSYTNYSGGGASIPAIYRVLRQQKQ